MDFQLPRGTRDFKPKEAILLNEIIRKISETYVRFGFYPIETPSIESTSTLNAKAYGEESTKEIFLIQDSDAGLRYDLTVPLSRYFALNKDMPLPFKRFQIGRIWRREEPQKMREREFIQADVDIVGSTSVSSDAEVIAAPAAALNALGIDYKIHINSRVLANGMLSIFGIEDQKKPAALRIIDKLEKISIDDAKAQLVALGIAQNKAEELLSFITSEEENKIQKLIAQDPSLKRESDKLGKLLSILKLYGIENVVTNLALVRGLDYYTGFVWEFKAEGKGANLPTITAGGRYDNLIGIFAGQNVPATGTSIGISRIFELLYDPKAASPSTYARLFVAYIGEENLDYAIFVAQRMRAAGIATDMNVMERSLSKQLEYANALSIRYAIILGDIERSRNKVKLRDLVSGNEVTLEIDAAIEAIKSD
ncbi:MAG: histidine--tRNA ligase [Candidatus Micrarchaeaceae archaeon]